MNTKQKASELQRGIIRGVIGPDVVELYGRLRAACDNNPEGLEAVEELKSVVEKLGHSCNPNDPEVKEAMRWGETLKDAVKRLHKHNQELSTQSKRLSDGLLSSQSQEWQQGYTAFFDGNPDNPYSTDPYNRKPDSVSHLRWEDGWRFAHTLYEQTK